MKLTDLESALIFSYMARPKDTNERMLFLHKSIVKYYAIRESREPNRKIEFARSMASMILTVGTVGDFSKSVLTPATEYFDQVYYECFFKGMLCGEVLMSAISNKISISQAIDIAIESMDEDNTAEQFKMRGVKTRYTKENVLNNIWPIYKNVSPYWAALKFMPVPTSLEHVAFLDLETYCTAPPAPPAHGFCGFAEMVEAIIHFALKYKAPRTKKTILSSHEVLGVMSALQRLLCHQL